MNMNKILVTAAAASAGALGVRGRTGAGIDVQWSVTLGTPITRSRARVHAAGAGLLAALRLVSAARLSPAHTLGPRWRWHPESV